MRMRIGARLAAALLLFAATASLAQEGPWLRATQHGNIAYFVTDSPAEIARYDLSSRAFLPPIRLSQAVTAFLVDDDGIYVVYDRDVVHFDLDGSNQTLLATADYTVHELVSFGNNLYGASEAYGTVDHNFYRIDKSTGTILERIQYFRRMSSMSISPANLKIFSRTTLESPGSMMQVMLAPDGTLGTQAIDPNFSLYPDAIWTYVFPDQTKVGDDSGTVYSTSDLTYVGNLGGQFDAIAFSGDELIVLRQNTVFRYTKDLEYAGELTAQHDIRSIFVSGGDIVGFYDDGLGNLAAEIIAIQDIVPPDPGNPVDPAGLPYIPDAAVTASDGTILLLSKANKSIFRWSPEQHSYTQSIPLAHTPDYFAYSTISNRVFLGYSNDRITQVDLATGTESNFANVRTQLIGLAMVDPFVFAVDPLGWIGTQFVFDDTGRLVSEATMNMRSDDYVWSKVNGKLYAIWTNIPKDIIWEDIDANGVLGAHMDSPYDSSDGMEQPIRVALDGSLVLLGSGRIFDAQTLEWVSSIATLVKDAQWRADGSIAAVWFEGGNATLMEFDSSFAEQKRLNFLSNFVMLAPYGDEIRVIWEANGVPQFFTWNFGTDDIDGDGVDDVTDDYPLDPTRQVNSGQGPVTPQPKKDGGGGGSIGAGFDLLLLLFLIYCRRESGA